jgi:crotonobetainyl-CoA:carnitine CoA-transferase CaiB-like acyl-CoA transferase
LNELQWSQFEVRQTQRPMFGPVETADGYVMLAIASEKTFQSLIKVIGHPEWIADPRFAIYADRRDNWAELMDGVESWSRTLTTEKCVAGLNGHGVPCSAYRTVAEALRDPQIAHRGALSEVGRRRHVQGSEPAVPHPAPMSPRESGWRPWASTRLRFSERAASRKMKSRPSQGNRWRRSGADASISTTAQDLRLFIRQPPPALPEPGIPANLTGSHQ